MGDGQDVVAAVRRRIGPVGVWTASFRADVGQQRAFVGAVEELGFGALWSGGGGSGIDELVQAGVLLAAGSRLVVGTAIASMWTRDAHAAANGARLLAAAYPGRFVFGLGVSHEVMVTPRGHDYSRPLASLRAYLDEMDAAPDHVPALGERPLRVLAALRPKALELARDHADGSHPYFTTVEHTAAARGILGPDRLLAPELSVVLDPDPRTARASARQFAERYLLAPNYRNNLLHLGYSEADLADGGGDRVIDALVAWGDADAIAARVREHLAAGADHVALQAVGLDLSGQLACLRQLAPALTDLLPG